MKYLVLFILVLIFIAGGVALAASSYALPRHTIGAGAQRQQAGQYILSDLSGQTVAGSVSTGNYNLCVGFWCGGAPHPAVSVSYLPVVARNWPSIITIPDAPQTCPGYAVAVGARYREDLDQANDNDWYSFVAAAGTTYTIQTSELERLADTVLTLYSPDCATLLAENDDRRPGDRSSLIVWTAPAAGTYHAMVRGYDWQIYGADTGYVFSVSAGGAAQAQAEIAPGKPAPLPTPDNREILIP